MWRNPFDREPAFLDSPLVDPQDLEGLEGNPDHHLYWAYGEEAGEWKFPFGKHKGWRLNQVPYSYLKWCKRKVHNHPRLQITLNRYYEGLINRIDDDYKDFRVLFGKKHQGKRLRECRDKPWMRWLVRWANHPNRAVIMQDKYDAFLAALQIFLENPTHQNVHRDIGENLDLTEDQDEEDLVNPDEYEDDVEGADKYDEDEPNPQDPAEVDAEGNLIGTVVPDNVPLEYENEQETTTPGINLDDDCEAQFTPSSSEDEGEQMSIPSNEAVDNVDPPQTPKRPKGKSRVINSPPTTDDDDAASSDDAPPRTPKRIKGTLSRIIVSPSPPVSNEDDIPLSELVPKEKRSPSKLSLGSSPATVGSSKRNQRVQNPLHSDRAPVKKRKAKPTASTNCSDGDDGSKASPKKRAYRAS